MPKDLRLADLPDAPDAPRLYQGSFLAAFDVWYDMGNLICGRTTTRSPRFRRAVKMRVGDGFVDVAGAQEFRVISVDRRKSFVQVYLARIED